MQKHLCGAVLGMSAFAIWALVSAAEPGLDTGAAVVAFLFSVAAGAILVAYLPFLAGLLGGAMCFVIWAALKEHGIHSTTAIILPVLMGWVLGVASLGFAVGVLVRFSVSGLLDRVAKH